MLRLNHIALGFGDVEATLRFPRSSFNLRLCGCVDDGAFVDLRDQFLALMAGPVGAVRGHRHFGLVVDDRSAVRAGGSRR